LILAAITAAIFIAGVFPRTGDLSAVWLSIIMLFLVFWMVIARFHGLPRRLAEGFAVFELASVSADSVRRFAVLHRRPSLWITATWTKTVVWGVVVVVWLIVFVFRPVRLERANCHPAQS
jgi:hypothetical protein